MNSIIKVEKLNKSFLTKKVGNGFLGTLQNLFNPEKRETHAVKELSFEIKEGERVAFIGPNGAGKSTTIKMMTGILHPTSGNLDILGYTPWKNRGGLGFKIGTVFGQRTQLWYHLPPLDTFWLLSKIYEIDSLSYRKRLDELINLFELSPFLHKPVRQLSLGERMRCELVASLLHQPKILFLDEPTIGLDINAKLMIRELLNRLASEYGTTLFLTSHDTADIEQVCERAIVLDKGAMITDTSLRELKRTYVKKKILNLITEKEKISLDLPGLKILENRNFHFKCEINVDAFPIDRAIFEILKVTTIKDITIEDLSMEEVIRLLYRAGENAD